MLKKTGMAEHFYINIGRQIGSGGLETGKKTGGTSLYQFFFFRD
jgi:hypothetical protein